MSRKQFILLVLAVLVIGGGGLLIYQRNNGSWENPSAGLGGLLLPGLPINDIAAITIEGGTNAVHLARPDNRWRVRERGNYPANFSQISDWLIKLSTLKIAQSEAVGPSQLGRFDLLPAGPAEHTATAVSFADAQGKPVGSLLLGKKHMKKPATPQPAGMGDEGWPDGRYVMTGNDTATLAVITDPLDNAVPQPEQWLDKDFLTVEKPKAITVEFPEATNSWTLTRASETNDWTLASAGPKEKLDAGKISGVTGPFSGASFNDVLPGNTAPSVSGLTNVTRVTVATFDGFTYAAEIGQKQGDNYPVTFTVTAALASVPAAGGTNNAAAKLLTDKLAREQQYQHWIYLMPTYAVDPVLKVRGDLLVTGTNAVAGTEGK